MIIVLVEKQGLREVLACGKTKLEDKAEVGSTVETMKRDERE
jgi:hypothetical protein